MGVISTALNPYKFLEYFEASTPDQLRDQLRQITLPFKILSVYRSGDKHIAWVNLMRPIRKEKLKQGIKNGSSIK